jgi:hypothetical protein
VRFEEKQWMPLWVALLFVAVPVVICLPFLLASPASAWFLLVPAGVGLFWAGVFWLAVSRRWIRVDDRSLRIGDRKPVRLTEISDARIVDGRELKRLRQAFTQGHGLPVAAAGLPAVPAAGGALGSLALGYSLLRGGKAGRGIKRGNLSEPWMRQAVLVTVPDDERTPALLIGTRRPQELLAALRGSSPGSSPLGGLEPAQARV